jgi:hypothetical protein
MLNSIRFFAYLQLFILPLIAFFFWPKVLFFRWGIDCFLYFSFAIFLVNGKLKCDYFFFIFSLLLAVTLMSYMWNGNEIIPLIKQVRFSFLAFPVFFLFSNLKLPESFFHRFIGTLFWIGYWQLPIVILQLVLFKLGIYQKPLGVVADNAIVAFVDRGVGTVGWGDSGVTGSYLSLLAIMKLHEGLEFGFSRKRIWQLLLLLSPLGLINSDAQFFFLPLVVVYMIWLNRGKMRRHFVKISVLIALLSILVNSLMVYNTKRDVLGYIQGRSESMLLSLRSEIPYNFLSNFAATRFDRAISMKLVIEEAFVEPSLLGKGPGYWLTRDSEGGTTSVTNIWYHCNTIVLMYGELGFLGIAIFCFIPLLIFLSASHSYWGKIIKVQAFYLFMLLFYNHPFNRLSLIFPIMCFFVYYQRFGKHLSAPSSIQ